MHNEIKLHEIFAIKLGVKELCVVEYKLNDKLS